MSGPTWKLVAVISFLSGRRRKVETVLSWHASFLKLLPLARGRARRTVTFLHGKEVWGDLPHQVHKGLRATDLFLTNSNYTWDRFLERHPAYRERPHQTVHLGIGETQRGQPKVPDAVPIAIMLGRMHRDEDYKGHREVIGAWPRVVDRIAPAQLIIIGEGNLLPELQRLSDRLELGSSVKFVGEVDDNEKERLMVESRCLALPSRGEGFGLVYLEAMRLGRPCLVGDQDAGREVVGTEAGISVDPSNTDAVASALLRLLTPGPEWDAMSQSASDRYKNSFTAEAFKARLVTALDGAGWG